MMYAIRKTDLKVFISDWTIGQVDIDPKFPQHTYGSFYLPRCFRENWWMNSLQMVG